MRFSIVFLSVIGCVLAGPSVSRSRSEIESFKSFIEKGRRGDGVRLDSRMLANPQASVWENSGKYEGDILLNDAQVEALVQQFAEGRNSQIIPNTKWPGNVIVYEFSNEFTNAQRNAIYAAMSEISQRTCVRFRARNWWENQYVLITGRADGCYANVGFWAPLGIHTLNLARDIPGRGCFHHNVIIHEWLHIVGFFHMQSSYNRDNYVRILWENIIPGMAHNFDKHGSNIVSMLGLPYEYESNMHYGRYGFSRNGQPTMLPLWNDFGLMGQIDFVTGRDWHRANRHSNCPGAWSAPVDGEKMYDFEDLLEDDDSTSIVEDTPQEVSVVENAPIETSEE